MKNLNKRKLLILAVFVLLFLTGCASNTGPDGNILPEKIISLTTSFQDILKGSWFDAFFIWPIAQLINYISQYINVVWAVGLVTVIVNLLILPITISSQESQQRMQLLQPEMDKINRKYEGKNDERSLQLKAKETQDLYKKHDIKMGATMLGLVIQLPIVMAMFYAVQRSSAVIDGVFLGFSLKTTPWAGITSFQMFYIILFILVGIAQFLSIKLPSLLTKKELKNDRRIKDYDKPKQEGPNQDMMSYGMLALILWISATSPAAMGVYWLFNALVNVAKTLYVQKIKMKK